MYVFLMAMVLQSIAAPAGPSTFPKPTPSAVPQLANGKTNTTPNLNPNEELIHINMEKDISGQGEAVGELKEKVRGLEDKREKIDRPDIDSLKETKTYFIWIWGILGTIATTLMAVLYKFGPVIWRDSIKPRLRRALIEIEHVDSN